MGGAETTMVNDGSLILLKENEKQSERFFFMLKKFPKGL
jgi:hypothetical protein